MASRVICNKKLAITFFANKFNGLSQRACLELQRQGHEVNVHEINKPEDMAYIAKHHQHDIIICPFLTKRVPREVWENKSTPCLIVHPGIEGDRGMHSLDWAIKNRFNEWGVTALEADEDMDAGAIWATKNFKINRDIDLLTKSSLYANEVTNAAVEVIKESVRNYNNNVPARTLNYSDQNVKGRLQMSMKNQDRHIDWNQSPEDISRLVRMSDTSPGATATLWIPDCEFQETFRVFGAHVEQNESRAAGKPGDIVAQRNGAVLVKCKDGFVWLTHLKKTKLKLPATLWLGEAKLKIPHVPVTTLEYKYGERPQTFQEIWHTVTADGVCYLHFEFYNGAMSTCQCRRLERTLGMIERDDRIKTVVLMGGTNYFSNGIHLNVIENAQDPIKESWENINAINDVIKAIFSMTKLTISAVQGNAGAGGCMMALASDYVWSRKGVVLNPHYTSMQLFGSEYHTHFLSARVGEKKANELTGSSKPLLGETAVDIGMFDMAMGGSIEEFNAMLENEAQEMNASCSTIKRLPNVQMLETLEKHRQQELAKMIKNFTSDSYKKARKAFVYH